MTTREVSVFNELLNVHRFLSLDQTPSLGELLLSMLILMILGKVFTFGLNFVGFVSFHVSKEHDIAI